MTVKFFIYLIFSTAVVVKSRPLIVKNENSNNIIDKEDKNKPETLDLDIEKEIINAVDSMKIVSFPPYTTYEVTENTSDVPDNRPLKGPIVINYTKPFKLNFGNPDKTTKFYITTEANIKKEKTTEAYTKKEKTTEENIKNKKNYVSILHINAEYDDKDHVEKDNKVVGLFKGIKEYIYGFHRGILNGIHSFFNKHEEHEHDHRHNIFKRDAEDVKVMYQGTEVKNVDKTDFFVRRKHISLT